MAATAAPLLCDGSGRRECSPPSLCDKRVSVDRSPGCRHGGPMSSAEVRAGVELTNLDKPLFDGADVTKRDLIDYLEFVGDRLVRQLRSRPLSVVRVRPRQEPFM